MSTTNTQTSFKQPKQPQLEYKSAVKKNRVIKRSLYEKLMELSGQDCSVFDLKCKDYNKLMDCPVSELKTRFRTLGMDYYNYKKKRQVLFLLELQANK